MSSSRTVITGVTEDSSIPELVTVLRSSFRKADFDEVQRLLLLREAKMQKELQDLRGKLQRDQVGGEKPDESAAQTSLGGDMAVAELENVISKAINNAIAPLVPAVSHSPMSHLVVRSIPHDQSENEGKWKVSGLKVKLHLIPFRSSNAVAVTRVNGEAVPSTSRSSPPKEIAHIDNSEDEIPGAEATVKRG